MGKLLCYIQKRHGETETAKSLGANTIKSGINTSIRFAHKRARIDTRRSMLLLWLILPTATREGWRVLSR